MIKWTKVDLLCSSISTRHLYGHIFKRNEILVYQGYMNSNAASKTLEHILFLLASEGRTQNITRKELWQLQFSYTIDHDEKRTIHSATSVKSYLQESPLNHLLI